MTSSTFSAQFLAETALILTALDPNSIEAVAKGLGCIRDQGGRLFILGVGGSAGHAGHAVNDFRKICHLESYAPSDNVSELTARVNDEGWDTSYSEWLKICRPTAKDAILVFSVGGGNVAKNISTNIVIALQTARKHGAKVFGIVGRNGGYTKEVADACVVIPPLIDERVTPHTEGICAIVWHLIVSHPALKISQTKWESSF